MKVPKSHSLHTITRSLGDPQVRANVLLVGGTPTGHDAPVVRPLKQMAALPVGTGCGKTGHRNNPKIEGACQKCFSLQKKSAPQSPTFCKVSNSSPKYTRQPKWGLRGYSLGGGFIPWAELPKSTINLENAAMWPRLLF